MRQIANPSSVTHVTLQRLIDMLDWNIGKAQHSIQAAQMAWLSVDFLSVDQLHDLNAWCLATAKMYNSKLIIVYPQTSFKLNYPMTIPRTMYSTRAARTYGTYWYPSTIDANINRFQFLFAIMTSLLDLFQDWIVMFSPSLTEKKDFHWKWSFLILWNANSSTPSTSVTFMVGSICWRFVHWCSLLAVLGRCSNALPDGSGTTNWGHSTSVWKQFCYSE